VLKVTFKVLTAWMGNPGAVVAETLEAKSKPKLNTLELNMLMCRFGISGLSRTFLVASYVQCSENWQTRKLRFLLSCTLFRSAWYIQ
jgi:hypothetical protein